MAVPRPLAPAVSESVRWSLTVFRTLLLVSVAATVSLLSAPVVPMPTLPALKYEGLAELASKTIGMPLLEL